MVSQMDSGQKNLMLEAPSFCEKGLVLGCFFQECWFCLIEVFVFLKLGVRLDSGRGDVHEQKAGIGDGGVCWCGACVGGLGPSADEKVL